MQKFEKTFQRAEKKRASSQFNDAIKFYLSAQQLCGNNSDAKLSCLLALGDCYRMVGAYEKAKRNYERAHKIAASVSDTGLAVDSLVGLGLTLRGMGKHRDALKIFAKSEKIYKMLRDKTGLAFCLWAKGGAYRIKGDLKKAIETFKRTLDLFVQLKDKSGIGYCYCGLGGASRILGSTWSTSRPTAISCGSAPRR